MKKKKGFNLRNVCGENIIMAEGIENIDFSKIISMNETAAYLWTAVGNEPFDNEQLVRLLTEEYEVDDEIARKDVAAMTSQWLQAGIVEE